MLSENATILFYTHIVSPPAITGNIITRTDFGDSSLMTRKDMAALFAIQPSHVAAGPVIFY